MLNNIPLLIEDDFLEKDEINSIQVIKDSNDFHRLNTFKQVRDFRKFQHEEVHYEIEGEEWLSSDMESDSEYEDCDMQDHSL